MKGRGAAAAGLEADAPLEAEVPLPVRECRRCSLWTQCGRCPTCNERLGDPPFAANVRLGELDLAPVAARVFVGRCEGCHCSLPFHRETCPLVRTSTARS